MRVLLGLLGLFIVLFTLYDVIRITLSVQRTGAFTSKIACGLWKLAFKLHRASPVHHLLARMGTAILLTTFALWVLFTWLGWTLVFTGGETAVVGALAKQPASLGGRIYFTGSTLLTLGNGDYIPKGTPWQIATILAAANGFFLLTLSVTYLLQVFTAALQKRQLAVYISGLGSSPHNILLNAWNGKDCRVLLQHSPTLTTQIAELGQKNLAFSILRYFHSTDQNTALILALARLDEALSLLEHGLDDSHKENVALLRPLREVISVYLATLQGAFGDAAKKTTSPAAPSLEPLQAERMNTVSQEEFQTALQQVAERRAWLLAFVEGSGWSWQAVYAAKRQGDEEP